jgi:hypothetical protein
MASKKAPTKTVAKKATKKATKKTTTKSTAPKLKAGEYSLKVETAGKVFEFTKIASIAEALQSIELKYTNTKSTFTVAKGKEERVVTHFRPQALRIIKNPIASRTFERNMEVILG